MDFLGCQAGKGANAGSAHYLAGKPAGDYRHSASSGTQRRQEGLGSSCTCPVAVSLPVC